MMKLTSDQITIYLHFTLIFGGAIFCFGFFPFSHSNNLWANPDELPTYLDDVPLNQSEYRNQFNRTILMIIDAFRRDFLDRNDTMEFTKKLIEDGDGCVYHLKANTPTVTLPRIKAMISGTIPNFVDVIFNLGNVELKTDSLLYQLDQRHDKIVFCGDQIWTKLFPNLFHRSFPNADSLFVNDFYQGDKNITRDLQSELTKSDWNVLILHYLGLDHIGHVEGPFSSKIDSKLIEMDDVVRQIITIAKEKDKLDGTKTMFFLTSDHGMRDTGGHGGSSSSEINIPLVVSGTRCSNSKNIYNQIDISPTLSAILGLPIPASSIGIIMPNLIESLSKPEQLYALQYNAKRLVDKMSPKFTQKELKKREFYIQYFDAVKAHKRYLATLNRPHDGTVEFFYKKAKQLYVELSREISNEMSNDFLKYDNFSIVLGVVLSTLTLIIISIHGLNYESKFVNLNVLTLNAIGILLFGILTKFFICKIVYENMSICTSDFNSTAIFFGLILFGFIGISIGLAEYKSFSISDCNPLVIFLVFLTCLHAISFSSSSFVEEEHQTWYYFTETFFVILFVLWLRNELSRKWSQNSNNKKETSVIQNIKEFHQEIYWLILFAVHIFLRRLNKTGDKWLSIPDISDWVQMEQNQMWNSAFAFFGIFLMTYNCIDFHDFLTNILSLTASLLIYYFRAISGSVHFSGIKPSESNISIVLFWLNIIEICCIGYFPIFYKLIKKSLTPDDVRKYLGINITIFCLISALLHKPYNIMLNYGILFTCYMVNMAIEKIFTGNLNIFLKTIGHFWIGKMFFFYQGNSNSLASIDINAGYVGLKSFNILIVGIFLTINTFNGPLLTYLNLIYNIYISNPSKGSKNIFYALRWIVWMTALPFTFYLFMVVLFRNHLFVWTVFSPKLLYEIYNLILIFVILFITFIVNKFVIFLS